MRRSLTAWALAGCIATAGPLAAFQFETTDDPECDEAPGVNCPHRGVPLSWRVFPVPFFINSDASGLPFPTARDAISAAFSTWQGASGGAITFAFAGQSHAGSDGQDGQNTISWQTLGSGTADTFGQSILTFSSDDGEIFDVDIELNTTFPLVVLPAGENNPSDPRADLQAITTHEVGHFSGLAHENTLGPQVVMFFEDTSGNTTHRTLTSDDQDGILAIYVGGGMGGGGGGGDGGGCAIDPNASTQELMPSAALLGVLVAREMARRRRLRERVAQP